MAYSSVRATLGGRDVKKTTRQARKPTYSTVSASTGSKSYKPTRSKGSYSVSSSGAKTYYPTSSSGASAPLRSGPSPAQVRAKREEKQRRQTIKKARKGIRENKRPRKVTIGVPKAVPKPYRKAVAKYGSLVEKPAKEKTGLSGPEYLAGLIQFESGFNKKAENPSSAYGLGQFIDSTAEDFRSRLGVETQDPKKPKQMIKGAAMHASGKFGYGALYEGYNPGYGSDPVPQTRAQMGPNIKVKVKKTSTTKAVSESTPKKLPGGWEGSKKAVLSVVPRAVRAEGRGDKRTPEENASVGGSPTSDHLTTNKSTYAADLPPDDAIAKKIAAKLGMSSHTGTQEVTKDGYRYQLIWQDAGHYDHIHIGAEWTGEGTQPASGATGAISALTGGSVSTPTGTSEVTAQAGAGTATKRVKRRGKSKRQKERERLLQEILAKPDRAPAPPSSVPLKTKTYTEYAKSRPVKVGLG